LLTISNFLLRSYSPTQDGVYLECCFPGEREERCESNGKCDDLGLKGLCW